MTITDASPMSISGARRLYRVAAISNVVVTVPAFVAYDRAVALLADEKPRYPFLVQIWAGMALLWGLMFWEISRDPIGKYPMIKYSWLEKMVTSGAVTVAWRNDQVPTRLHAVDRGHRHHLDPALHRDATAAAFHTKGARTMTRRVVGIHFRERANGTLACRADHGPFEGHDHLQWEPLSIDLMAYVHRPSIGSSSRPIIPSVSSAACFGAATSVNARSPTVRSICWYRLHEPDERLLRYSVCFSDQTGRQLTIFGYKDIRGRRFRVWYDTTRIFIELYEGTLLDHDRDRRWESPLVGVGVLEIPVHVFALQLPTIRTVAPPVWPWVSGYVRFMWFFSKNLTIPYWKGLLRRRQRGGAPWGGANPSRSWISTRRPGDGPNGTAQNPPPVSGKRVSSTTTVGVDEGAPEYTPFSGVTSA